MKYALFDGIIYLYAHTFSAIVICIITDSNYELLQHVILTVPIKNMITQSMFCLSVNTQRNCPRQVS